MAEIITYCLFSGRKLTKYVINYNHLNNSTSNYQAVYEICLLKSKTCVFRHKTHACYLYWRKYNKLKNFTTRHIIYLKLPMHIYRRTINFC